MTRSARNKLVSKPDPLSAGFTSKCWPIPSFGVSGSVARPNLEMKRVESPFSADDLAPAIDSTGGGRPLRHIHPCLTGALAVSFLAAGALAQVVSAQEPAKQRSNTGHASPVGNQAVDHNPQKRSTTADRFVDSGPVILKDITAIAGLAGWKHKMGAADKKLIIDTNGSGVGLIDYDNDGWLDIYLVNGSTFDAMDGKEIPPHAALFHNNHDGTFSDVAAKAAVTQGNWSAGATWGDYDGDGRLDLFVSGYVHFDRDNLPYEKTRATGFSYCEFRGEHVMCGPKNLQGEPDHLFHNNGDGTFTDASVKAGVADEVNRYYGLTPVFVDANNDGKLDLLVANDSTLSYLYLNRGNGTFEDASFSSGFGLNEDGHEVAAMGVAVGDYSNNGRLDFAISDFSDEAKLLRSEERRVGK